MDSSNAVSALQFPTIWELLALSDERLEKTDLVVMNLAVARGISGLESLDIEKYVRIVDAWTEQFRHELPGWERNFKATPWKWKNDIRFFRIGMLQGFLGHVIGIRYHEDQINIKSIRYTDPGHLFLHGVLDTKRGTCGNMATLHVAIARRMGWPVTLACAKSHKISRFDDGKVIHNIEATSNQPGSFASDSDEDYIKRFDLPKRAIECGSDLCRLTARQMMATFIQSRGRLYVDTNQFNLAEVDHMLARVLFPQLRIAYVGLMTPYLNRGKQLFNPDEIGHPKSFFRDFGPQFGMGIFDSTCRPATMVSDITSLPARNPDVYVARMPGVHDRTFI